MYDTSNLCQHCNEELTGSRTAFCSALCKRTYRAQHEIRHCKECNKTPQETSFPNNKNTYDRLATYCRVCSSQKQSQRDLRKSPQRKAAEHLRKKEDVLQNTVLKRKFGITIEEYKTMLAKQSYACAICQIAFSDKELTQIDHDHKSNQVRGVLCRNCNWGLGHFKDNSQTLALAIAYLKETAEADPSIDAALKWPGERRLDLRHLRPLRFSYEGRVRLLVMQSYKCKLCLVSLRDLFRVDHHHEKGHVRGILCKNCNIGIGNFKESKDNPFVSY